MQGCCRRRHLARLAPQFLSSAGLTQPAAAGERNGRFILLGFGIGFDDSRFDSIRSKK